MKYQASRLFTNMAYPASPFLGMILGFFNTTTVEIVNVQGVNILTELKRLANEHVKILCYMCVLPSGIYQDEALG